MSYREINLTHPKARKMYRCEWCNIVIVKGERHMARVYNFCGEFQHGRMHLECEVAMEKSTSGLLSEGWQPGEFKRGEVWK